MPDADPELTVDGLLAATRELLGTPQPEALATARRIAADLVADPDDRRIVTLFLYAQYATNQLILRVVQEAGIPAADIIATVNRRQLTHTAP